MKSIAASFEGQEVLCLAQDGLVLFPLKRTAEVVGYAKPHSITQHVGNRIVDINGVHYLSVKALNALAKRATRTPRVKVFAAWAKGVQDREQAREEAAQHVAKQSLDPRDAWPFPRPKTDFTLKEAAEEISMSHSDFITWMLSKGYLDKYSSNGHLKMSKWFKEQGYGMNPIADSGRISNTVRVTDHGLVFIKNRLNSERESGVLSFAIANPVANMEKQVDELVRLTFREYLQKKEYSTFFNHPDEYVLTEAQLQKKVREVIAQVKVKEKNNGS